MWREPSSSCQWQRQLLSWAVGGFRGHSFLIALPSLCFDSGSRLGSMLKISDFNQAEEIKMDTLLAAPLLPISPHNHLLKSQVPLIFPSVAITVFYRQKLYPWRKSFPSLREASKARERQSLKVGARWDPREQQRVGGGEGLLQERGIAEFMTPPYVSRNINCLANENLVCHSFK